MKIALFHNLPSGGAKRAVLEWTQYLSRNHEIDVYTTSTANHSFCDIRPLVQKYQIYNFSPHRLFQSPWGRLNQFQRWLDLRQLDQIGHAMANEINGQNYDVFFVHPCQYTFMPAVMQFVRIPSVYYLHEPIYRPSYPKSDGGLIKSQKLKKAADLFDPFVGLYRNELKKIQMDGIKKTTSFLANSNFTRQTFYAEVGRDSSVVYSGVNPASFRPLPEMKKENYLISVGELSRRKGFDFLIKSLALLPAENRPKLKLICNKQDDEERSYIVNLAGRLNVALEILTNLNTDQLALEYNRARLCIYSPNQEPFGLVPLEAMACGLAVVGVREGGVCETIKDGITGVLVERDPKAFSDAVINLLNHPEVMEEMGERGRACVTADWTWEKSAEGIEQALEKVIAG